MDTIYRQSPIIPEGFYPGALYESDLSDPAEGIIYRFRVFARANGLDWGVNDLQTGGDVTDVQSFIEGIAKGWYYRIIETPEGDKEVPTHFSVPVEPVRMGRRGSVSDYQIGLAVKRARKADKRFASTGAAMELRYEEHATIVRFDPRKPMEDGFHTGQ